jgi:hypothetical protein
MDISNGHPSMRVHIVIRFGKIRGLLADGQVHGVYASRKDALKRIERVPAHDRHCWCVISRVVR